MNDKDKLDGYLALMKHHAGQHDRRRDTEWKVTLTIWAALLIFTTHNPNVAVGADAELSHILDATADKGIIESSGAIDHEETNKLLLVHLEGGKEALERRVQKYGL